MNNITSILPRLQASNLSKIEHGMVNSDNALREINRQLEHLDRRMAGIEYNFLYWSREK